MIKELSKEKVNEVRKLVDQEIEHNQKYITNCQNKLYRTMLGLEDEGRYSITQQAHWIVKLEETLKQYTIIKDMLSRDYPEPKPKRTTKKKG